MKKIRSALVIPLLATASWLACATSSLGAELVVNVSGLKSDEGALGCALFGAAAADAFPLDLKQATTQRAKAQPGSMRCVFMNLAAGSYAVSASHDLNDNGKTDRNFIGQPTEPWAVSNNVRPALRAPRFAECAFSLAADEVKQIELRLAQ